MVQNPELSPIFTHPYLIELETFDRQHDKFLGKRYVTFASIIVWQIRALLFYIRTMRMRADYERIWKESHSFDGRGKAV